MILRKNIVVGQKILMFHSYPQLFSGTLRSSWVGHFVIFNVFPHGIIEIKSLNTMKEFKINGHR